MHGGGNGVRRRGASTPRALGTSVHHDGIITRMMYGCTAEVMGPAGPRLTPAPARPIDAAAGLRLGVVRVLLGPSRVISESFLVIRVISEKFLSDSARPMDTASVVPLHFPLSLLSLSLPFFISLP
jgi:hypothetical protein